MSNEKSDFVVRKLKEYSKETGSLVRSTSDLSPLEEWLFIKWHHSIGEINYENLVTIGEALIFMNGYKGTCGNGEWSEWDESVRKKLEEIIIKKGDE